MPSRPVPLVCPRCGSASLEDHGYQVRCYVCKYTYGRARDGTGPTVQLRLPSFS